ncbi:uncharacterized protein At2g29880-like [Gossypium raimondii]|uniref:uncharacterized protein At2g29880-like n=1 Tax=Gossypium raimondii TaxID=29730 RepID=UPI002279FDCA|nr:uncharacterized protein At2g29880-like [Gossypium raimondii]
MSGVSESNVPSQSSRGTKRKWVPEEYASLVSCMVDLHNVGTFNDVWGSKRLLKRVRKIGFGWDDHRQVIVAEDVVWDSYLKSHKEAGQFRDRSFPYYDQLTAIYAKDRTTGKDAQTAADVLEEINAEDVPSADINEDRNEYYDCDANVSLDDMDVSATEPQTNKNQGVNDASTLLAENMRAIGEQISRSIASNVVVHQRSEEYQSIQEKASNLYPTLCEIEGLTVDERFRALSKIPNHPTQMHVFFSLPSDVRLEWVRRFLPDH